MDGGSANLASIECVWEGLIILRGRGCLAWIEKFRRAGRPGPAGLAPARQGEGGWGVGQGLNVA